jgi:putative aldouronate transport system permease protein
MRYRTSVGSKIFDAANYVLMFLVLVVMIYPFLNVIAMSMSSNDAIMMGKVTVFPRGFNLTAYRYMLQDKLIWSGYVNTIAYAAGGTFIVLLFTSMMAYPLMIPSLLGRKTVTIFLTITMFFGGGLIPTYLLIKNLHMIDTYWVMVVPGCVGAYNVFMFRTFFKSLPYEMREAALIDGANDLYILLRIYLPLSKALLATFALFTIVGYWNGWFNALIYLNDERAYPIQLIVRRYLFDPNNGAGSSITNNELLELLRSMQLNTKTLQMAVIVITMMPIAMIYPFLQKYFVKGVMLGSIKG